MKPKNRIYCRECGRSKLLFETEKKALTFIKFNGEEMLRESGFKPERAYFCECCGGWHVTSKKVTGKYNRTQKAIEAYNSTLVHPEIERLVGVSQK